MFLILLAVVSLMFGAGAALFLKSNRNRVVVSLVAHTVACICVLVSAIPVLLNGSEIAGLVSWSFPVNNINLRLDPLSAFFLIFSIPMTLLGSLYATGYLAPYFERKRNAGIHFALLNMVSLSYIIIYLVENAITFLLGWEIAALSAWLLVIWDYRNQKIRFAGFNYLVSTHVGLLFLIAAFMLLHSSTGSFEFSNFHSVLGQSSPYRNITFLLLVTSFALKSAFFPFHTWLPRAHSAAPAHVSALMSGVIHKAGLYGILRFTLLMGLPEEWMGWYLIGFSALSAAMGVLYTITQRDLKRLLGYSSTENVGIAGMGIGLGYLGIVWKQPTLVAFGFAGAILHIANHALFKCLLFYAAGCIYRMAHTVDIERLGGLIKKMPRTAVYFLVGGLAMSGAPLLNGFVSEFLIFNGFLRDWKINSVDQGIFIFGAALLSLIGAVSVIAVVRSFGISFLGQARDEKIKCSGEAPTSMRIPMAVHAVGIAAIGLVPSYALLCITTVVQQYLKLSDVESADALMNVSDVLAPLSQMSLLAVSAIAVVWAVRRLLARGTRRHVTWACGYLATHARMQYTGSSFSDSFIHVFQNLLRLLKREQPPAGLFPKTGYLNTHYVDAIERRMFKVIGEGEHLVQTVAIKIREESPIAFAMGLLVILVVVTMLMIQNGVV